MCWLFHKWKVWSDPYEVTSTYEKQVDFTEGMYYTGPVSITKTDTIYRQKRKCSRCGEVQFKTCKE